MPLIIHEDEHLLAAVKPAGMNTHSPGPFAGEGLYEWLKNREPRWSRLAIIHRLDKETSGVIVFSKTPAANRSLTEQFENRRVRKKYLLLTDRPAPAAPFTARSCLVRSGDRYLSRPIYPGGDLAETQFTVLGEDQGRALIEARPLTGKTHQIRVHAADHGFPVLGDTFYGGSPFARVCLHAAEITFAHPETGKEITLSAPPDFEGDPRLALRESVIDPAQTNAYRLLHGAADAWPGLYADRLGSFLLAQSESPLTQEQLDALQQYAGRLGATGLYHRLLLRQAHKATVQEASPRLLWGEPAPETFAIRENGIQFELRFDEGYSVGLFLDQRDNRRRLLTGYIAPEFDLGNPGNERPLKGMEILNAFAYTCGFSVCAAAAGARATSLDLSKKYLEWGRRNFQLNGLDPAAHDFIYGDAFEWMRRLDRKGRRFDIILLDPPTFSRSKESGAFRADKDYGKLVRSALPLLKPGGTLFASANAAGLQPEDFLRMIETAAAESSRPIALKRYIPQPPDFPLHRAEPAHLKTAWFRFAAIKE